MANINIAEILSRIGLFYVPMLFALCFHEYAHGWVARLKGDRTAEIMGRLTLNPMAHIDYVGTVIMPILAIITQLPLFGWANPVPVNSRNLKHPVNDMFWIALAGPLSNVLLAVVGGVLLILNSLFLRHLEIGSTLEVMIQTFMLINLYLALFNLIPLHPLDGGKVLARFLPEAINRKLEEQQMIFNMLLIAAFVMGGFVIVAAPAKWILFQMLGAVNYVLSHIG